MLHIGDTTIEHDGNCWHLAIPNPDRVIKGHKVEGRGEKTTYYGNVEHLILALYEKEVIAATDEGKNLLDAVVAAHDSLSKQIGELATTLRVAEGKPSKLKVNGKMPQPPAPKAQPQGRVRKVKPPKAKA